jgi:hypothetical protein
MKIELDYDNKIINLENRTELKKFIKTIQKILPDWQEWMLDTHTTINWTNPITIPYVPVEPYPIRPWWEQPYVWYGDSPRVTYHTNTSVLESEPVSGKYQIEVK